MSNNRVFFSYSRKDSKRVNEIYQILKLRGVNLWLDTEDMKAGKWRNQIFEQISKSRYFVFFLSNTSILNQENGTGFQDKELNRAVEFAMSLPEEDFNIIPVRIDVTEVTTG